MQREEIPEIPEVALREVIINAACHRDYFQKGANVMVEVFDDRVEITNPGGLPSDLRPEEFGTKSVVRNPVIASLLLRADYIERLGTGINRIKNAVKEFGKGDVTFSFTSFFTVIFSRLFNNKIKTVEETVEKILCAIKANPKVTQKQLAEKTGLTPRGIEWNLKKLKKKALIKRIGPTKRWTLGSTQIKNDSRELMVCQRVRMLFLPFGIMSFYKLSLNFFIN
ncbi:MAG: winged helix-turn-helix transcriptional regulator [Desulfobacteraceae bacterium]|nr:winged helix-turn-helix transcriptional regulator [Desulfobacteraceae bacterium]